MPKLPEEPGKVPGDKGSSYDKRGRKREEPEAKEPRETRDTRKKSGSSINASQTSISMAFGLVLAGIIARRHWYQKFAAWIRR